MTIKDPKVGMKVRDPESKTKTIYEISGIHTKGRKYVDQFVVIKLNQWFTKEHYGTLVDDWEEVK